MRLSRFLFTISYLFQTDVCEGLVGVGVIISQGGNEVLDKGIVFVFFFVYFKFVSVVTLDQ